MVYIALGLNDRYSASALKIYQLSGVCFIEEYY